MSDWTAFAKLTLSLRVLGVREDGYHELDALTVSVTEPHDDVTVEIRGDRVDVEVSGRAAAGVTDGADNLAARAVHALLDNSTPERQAVGVRIAIQKQIPAGGGLGGGSADAAAVLVALDRMLQLGLSVDGLAAIGAGIGSDVPFCVRGGAARMQGRGERIEPVTVPTLHVLVAVPPFAISTPAVYRAWDELGGPRAKRVVGAPFGLRALTNDLDAAAARVEPRLAGFREQLELVVDAPAILAGSGSACAVLFESKADADAACDLVVDAAIASTCHVGVTRSSGVEPA